MSGLDSIRYTNHISFGNKGDDFLDGSITKIFNQDDVSLEYQTDVIKELGFTYTQALSPKEKFSVMVGSEELGQFNSGEDIPTISRSRDKGKGYTIKQFGGAIEIEKLFLEWLKSAKTLEGADSSVKEAWAEMANNIKALKRGRRKTVNYEALKLFTEGWDSTKAYGPGSATPNGMPLFSSAHPYNNGQSTFRNVLTTPDQVLSSASLQDALTIIKNTRLQNGDRVMSPSKYILVTSRVNAVAAREILNTDGNQVNVLTAEGENSSAMNKFSFKGNMVELLEVSQLGAPTKSGGTIGTDDYWFLINVEAAQLACAHRVISLYGDSVETERNTSNRNYEISLDLGFAIEHIGLENYVVGSRGTVA